jgi:hypothetical protein
MTPRTGIVIVQSGNRIKPEQTPEIGQLVVNTATEPVLERRFDAAGEAGVAQRQRKFVVQLGYARQRCWIMVSACSRGWACHARDCQNEHDSQDASDS